MSSGLQFAVTAGGFAALGYWLDGRYGWSPWGTVGLSLAGVAAGMYYFIKETL